MVAPDRVAADIRRKNSTGCRPTAGGDRPLPGISAGHANAADGQDVSAPGRSAEAAACSQAFRLVFGQMPSEMSCRNGVTGMPASFKPGASPAGGARPAWPSEAA